MKRFTKAVILIILATAAAFSCKKDDTLRYNNATMGIFEGDVIISDQGNTFDIVEKDSRINLNRLVNKRVMIICDVLKETATDRYDIRLKSADSVLVKPCVKKSELTENSAENSANDPIIIKTIWYSGGYLNMWVEFARKPGSSTVHYVHLVNDDTVTENGKYTFTFLHDAKGETPSEDDKEYSSAFSYVSFPIADLIKEDEVSVTIKWKSHKFTGSGYSLTETEEISNDYTLERGGFEHDIQTVKTLF